MRGGKLKKILFISTVIVGIAVFAAGSYSLAKYVSTKDAENKAGVAGMGVKVFELDKGSRSTNIDYTQVVPGYDLPVPRISLHVDSEVGFTVYLAVTEGSDVGGEYKWTDPDLINGNAILGKKPNDEPCEVVKYEMAPWWNFLGLRQYEEDGKIYTVKYYSYNLGKDTEHGGDEDASDDFMLKAGKEYNYTGDKAIGLLKGDAIIISEYYGVKDTPPKFSLAFEAYIRQSLG